VTAVDIRGELRLDDATVARARYADPLRQLSVVREESGIRAASGGVAAVRRDLLGSRAAGHLRSAVLRRPCGLLVKRAQADVVLGFPLNQASGCAHSAGSQPGVRQFASRVSSSRVPTLRVACGSFDAERGRLLPLPDGLSSRRDSCARLLGATRNLRESTCRTTRREGGIEARLARDNALFLRVLSAAFLYRREGPLAINLPGRLSRLPVRSVSRSSTTLSTPRVQEWMIYRFLVSQVLGRSPLSGWAQLSHARSSNIARSGRREFAGRPSKVGSLTQPTFGSSPGLCFFRAGGALARELFRAAPDGGTYEHWSPLRPPCPSSGRSDPSSR